MMDADMWEDKLYKLEADATDAWYSYMHKKAAYGPKDYRTLQAQAEYEDAAEMYENHTRISPTGSWLDVNE